MHDPDRDTFLREVLAGLGAEPKTLPCKYFYDEAGSKLFDDICELPEYYPTRTELQIMQDNGAAMAQQMETGVKLIEYGSGSSIKTRILLDHLEEPAAYVPVDISGEHLTRSAEALSRRYPGLRVLPVCADFSRGFPVPVVSDTRSSIVYFPGSTIGNFDRPEAEGFLRKIARSCGKGGRLLIGVDLVKDLGVLERAYNDAAGVTAAFNLNLLHRINRELDGNFDLGAFEHRAIWNGELSRIEMHLISQRDQSVEVDGYAIAFLKGESIQTESSHKYRIETFAEMALAAGFTRKGLWTDPKDWFSVQLWELE
jgi:dimethylhistidine N-methyltransferase